MPKQRRNKTILGITGIYGSGKSTVSGLFKAYGALVVDADRIAHSLLKPGTGENAKIISSFGENVLSYDKIIDRKKLAKAVFGDKERLKRLNRIIHPAVIRIIKEQAKKSRKKVIIIDAPLLFESGLDKFCDAVVTVCASSSKRIKRIKIKNPVSTSEIISRVKSQMPLSKKIAASDFCIDNDRSLMYTKKQVKTIWEEIANEVRK